MSATPHQRPIPRTAGRTRVEASAGTGKTYTIAEMVTDKVIEGVPLEQIVVVTFTRAATAELRRRIRERMGDDLRKLRSGEAPARIAEEAERLEEALARFDRAQIFTIHGFAQRLLGKLGLRSRLPAELEPDVVDDALLSEVASDLVVSVFADSGLDGFVRPRDAAAIGKRLVETPDAKVVPHLGDHAPSVARRIEIAHAMRERLEQRMRLAGAVTFDDGLLEARYALADPVIGEAARRLLESQYTIAFVDEAQDTDPVQWDVLSEVFKNRRLVVIGDPKQSIYSFRGADIEAYKAAIADADRTDPLDTNWRSDADLVDALDRLFADQVFGDRAISYQRVISPDARLRRRVGGPGAPLTIRKVAPDIPNIDRWSNGSYYLLAPLRALIAADAADGIARMLSGGQHTIADERYPSGERPVRPGDFAVLCRTKAQVDLVRSELGARRVPSVSARTGSVFDTDAAEQWRRFLLAVERPDRTDYVRLAATTQLVGLSPADVAALDGDAVLDLQQEAKMWREMLHTGGVPALLERLGRERNLAGRLLAKRDGERTMTDLVHISEELHAVWRRGRTASLVVWLETTMAEARDRAAKGVEEPESRQRRLETDADAVQVQTVHGSKGLEYPIVLVPFAWDTMRIKAAIPVFHGSSPSSGAPGRRPRLVDVGGPSGEDFETHQQADIDEASQEEERLLYVAMTRARHRLVVWAVAKNQYSEEELLHRMLYGAGRSPESLAAQSGGAMVVTVLSRPPQHHYYEVDSDGERPLAAATFDRALDHLWRRASFTSLSPEHPVTTPDEASEEPGADDEAHPEDDIVDVEDGAMTVVPALGLPLAEMPRGARFGTLVHHIFEHADLSGSDSEADIRRVLEGEMVRSVWDLDADALVEGILAAAATPLGPEPDDVRLADLDAAAVLDEMRFELPVRTGHDPLSLADIGAVMLDHLESGDPYRRYATELVDGPQRPFRGYLTGAIDVTAALPGPDGPRYVVMDYKSNAMPSLGEIATAHDYGPGPLAEAMIDGNYVLQATLYQVALHRYLQWRLADYDPDRHLGGAMYLFVRGMAGPDTPVVDGERCGVVRWRPPSHMITALSDLFATPGVALGDLGSEQP